MRSDTVWERRTIGWTAVEKPVTGYFGLKMCPYLTPFEEQRPGPRVRPIPPPFGTGYRWAASSRVLRVIATAQCL
jgi:hypothetical protein